MKINSFLPFLSCKGFRFANLFMFLLFIGPIQAQKPIVSKGYGDAVYQGIQEDVFLTKWLILGPLAVSDKPGEPDKEIVKIAYEKDLFNLVPVSAKSVLQPVLYQGKKIEWRYFGSQSDTINLKKVFDNTDYIFCYALAEIISPEQAKVLIGLGSDDGVKMWINGKEVHGNFTDRALAVDDDLCEVTLNKGSNQVLLKILNSAGDFGFCIRKVSGTAIGDLLLKAASNGDLDNIKTLLGYSPDINKKNETGLTSWQMATIKGRTEIADYLKANGALSSNDFPAVREFTDGLFEKINGKAPGGAVLIAKNGKILYKNGYGLADIGFGIPVTTATKFRIGSITKQFIGAAILKLQEEGKISVQDKLAKFIPDFPRGDEVTIHHLLTHTSGIHSYTSRPDFIKLATVSASTQEMIDIIRKDTFDFNPGDQFRYNNSGYFILGYVIEKITGKPYGEYLKEAIFTPLGMKNTGVHTPGVILENEATGYAINNGRFEKSLNWDMSRAGGAGSLYSTVEDLYLWDEALFNGKVLKPQSLQAAFTPVVLNNGGKPQEFDYGYGWTISEMRNLKFISHGGGLHGFLSQIIRQPEDSLTVVVLTNCVPPQANTAPDQVANSLAEYILWQKMGKQQSYATDTTISAEDLKKFEGRYDYGNAMVLMVTAEDDNLFAQMTGQPRFRIFPKGNNEFYWKVVEARIRFVSNASGDVTGAIHYQGGRELNVDRLTETKTIKIDQAVLEKYAGDYQYEPNVLVTITVSNGHLFGEAAGQHKTELFPVSETEFAAKDIDAGITFIPDETGFKMKIRIGRNERIVSKVK